MRGADGSERSSPRDKREPPENPRAAHGLRMTTPAAEAQQTLDHAFTLNGQHPADRVANDQAIRSDVHLRGDPAPTRNQIAAVMHALVDLTHQKHMLGVAVASLGVDRSNAPRRAGDQATGLGRYFHALGDHLGKLAVPSAEVGRTLRAVYQTVLGSSGPMSLDDVAVVQNRIEVLSRQSGELREAFFLASLLDHEYARGIRCSVCNKVDNPLCTEEC